jgi:hypothetical protein
MKMREWLGLVAFLAASGGLARVAWLVFVKPRCPRCGAPLADQLPDLQLGTYCGRCRQHWYTKQ